MTTFSLIKLTLCANLLEDLWKWEEHFLRLLGAGQVYHPYGYWQGFTERNSVIEHWTDDLCKTVQTLLPELKAYQEAEEQQVVFLQVFDNELSKPCFQPYFLATAEDYEAFRQRYDPAEWFK